jgi:hypothetical protein
LVSYPPVRASISIASAKAIPPFKNQEQKERNAEEACDDSDRQFAGRKENPSQGIAEEEKKPARQSGGKNQPLVLRPED